MAISFNQAREKEIYVFFFSTRYASVGRIVREVLPEVG